MTPGPRLIVRFTRYQRLQHMLMFISFLGLAATGLPLLFSDRPWSAAGARIVGGVDNAGIFHRVFASILLAVFLAHVAEIAWRVFGQRRYGLLWGSDSLVPQPQDAYDLWHHFLWFIGKGPRPRFDRFTYWEKFDYWAVFWGMFVIGGSGMLLWFPEFFSAIVPGWVYNIALIVHGEEALLATGFIFTIHFFNSHFRPERFPMDLVMFTGQVSEHELRDERPAEYDRLVAAGALKLPSAAPEPEWMKRGGAVIGTAAVAVGLVLLVLIAIGIGV
jgi:cytochrome b subunit of formate dehydrogenase